MHKYNSYAKKQIKREIKDKLKIIYSLKDMLRHDKEQLKLYVIDSYEYNELLDIINMSEKIIKSDEDYYNILKNKLEEL